MKRTLRVLCEAVGPPLGTTDIQVHNDVWDTLVARKRRWAARQGFDREACHDVWPLDLEHARRHIRCRKGGRFAPISVLRDGRGWECMVDRLQELPRQMEAKHGRPVGFFPDEGAGHSGLDYTLGELEQVVRGRKPSAPGKSGVWAAAMKKLRAPSLQSYAPTGCHRCIRAQAIHRDGLAVRGAPSAAQTAQGVHRGGHAPDSTRGGGGQDHSGADLARDGLVVRVVLVGVPSGTLSRGSGPPHGDDRGRGPGE